MSLIINTNVASLTAQMNLANTSMALQGNISHLSSGLRISQAADDPAAMGISQNLQAQVASYAQDSRNANDGISMIQTAEGAMNQQAGLLTQLRTLAVQSANGALSQTERGYIDTEAQQVSQEVDRIAATANFNGVNMLSSGASVSMQVGLNATSNDTISVAFAKTDSTSLGAQYGVGDAVDLGTSAATAQASIANIDTAINALSSARAQVGAVQNRLQVTVSNLASAGENASAANAQIADVDVASETAKLAQNQVLSQAGISVLAQANQLPQMALKLLQ